MAECLCCQKPVEGEGRYHPRCLSRLFGSARLPAIPFRVADMPALVEKAGGHISISGVQMKLSVRLDREKNELESVPTGGTHILKPEPDRFPQIPQNENLCMSMAEELGFRVPPHGLLAMSDGRLCYVIKRFDRSEDGGKIPTETMFQILGSKDKYAGSLEQVGKAIRSHAANVGLDSVDFFERVVLCFLIGNGDMHLKNWALLGQGKSIGLAPVYDFVSSRLYIKNEEDSALTVNGKRNKLKRSDFEVLAEHLRLDPKAAANVFEKFRGAQETLRRMALSSQMTTDFRQEMADVIKARHGRLFGREG